MMLIAMGIVLIALGCAIMSTSPWEGIVLIIMGIMLVLMGIMMLMMAMKMGAQAKALANQLQSAYGQQYQQENVDDCVQKAISNGTDPNACNSPNPDPHYGDSASDATGVQKAVNDERSAGAYYDDNGQPVFSQ